MIKEKALRKNKMNKKITIINYKKMSYQYHTNEKKKEKHVEDALSLHCGQHPITRNSSPSWL